VAPLGPAQRVGPHPDQQLPPAWFPDRFAYEIYLPSRQKRKDEHLPTSFGQYGLFTYRPRRRIWEQIA
jgi:hypothetical protein